MRDVFRCPSCVQQIKRWTSIDVSCGQCVKCTPSSLYNHFSSTHHFTAWTQFVLPVAVLFLKPVYNFSKWVILKCATTTTTTVLRPFFRAHPGEPVPEENLWTLWCKRRLTEADTPTIRLGATCLEGKGENYQVCSVQYCVQPLCTVRCTHMNRLTVLWIGFCLTRPISLC